MTHGIDTPAPSTTRLFLIGLITAFVIRGGLFLISFGEFAPGLGWEIYRLPPAAAEAFELLITAALVAAAIYGAMAERGAGYAYRMGLVFIADCVTYSVQIPLAYRGEDAPVWLPVVLVATQIPLAVISILLINRGRKLSRSGP